MSENRGYPKEEKDMWKKNEADPVAERAQPAVAPPRAAAPQSPSAKPARIGANLFFKGELQGDEDLIIEGRVEGRISIKQGSVTVGDKGRVEADIEAASIQVAGTVRGNLTGADRVVLLESGRVEGNITAKSVILENGCRFKGSIDMEADGSRSQAHGQAKGIGASSSSASSSSSTSSSGPGAKPNGSESSTRVGV
jgi:cytoskeletal protein CcmA (bactofilin family)